MICTDRQADRLADLQHRLLPAAGGGPHLSLLTKPKPNWTASARCWRARKLPPIYNRAALRSRQQARNGKPKAASRIGASSCRARKCSWTDLVRGAGRDRHRHHVRSRAGARGRRLSLHPAVGGRRYRHGHHAMWCAARIMSPTPPPRSKSSRRWAPPCPPSRISRCWSARAARRCPSGWARCRWSSCARTGIEPLAVASYLAKIGTSDPVEPRLSLDELAGEFDFAKIGRAPAHFVPEELDGAERQDCCTSCPTARWRRACRHAAKRSGMRSSPT